MAEEIREVKARLTIEKKGDTEAIRDTATGLRDLGTAARDAADGARELASVEDFDALGASLDQLTTKVGGAFDPATTREFAQGVEEAGRAMESAEAGAGRLGDATKKNVFEVIGLGKEYAAVKGEIEESEEAIRRNTTATGELGEKVRSLAPLVTEFLVKWGSVVVLTQQATAALAAASKEAEGFVQRLGGSDDAARQVGAQIRDMAAPWNVLLGKSESYKVNLDIATTQLGKMLQQTTDVANEQAVLVEFTKLHAEGMKEAAEQQKVFADQQARIVDFQKQVAGFSLEGLATELRDLVAIGAELEKQNLIEKGPFADALLERINKATQAIDAYGNSITGKLDEKLIANLASLKDRLTEAAVATDAYSASQQQLAEQASAVVGELEKEIETLGDVRQNINDLATDANDSLSRLIGKFQELNEAQQPDRVVDLKQRIAELSAEYDSLGASLITTTTTEQRRIEIQEQIFQLTDQIDEAQSSASASFVDNAQDQIAAQAEFSRLLGDYQAQIKQLPEEVRPALESIIRQWQFTNEKVQLGSRDIEEFKATWVANLDIARRTIDGWADQTEAALGRAKTTAEATAEAMGASWERASSGADGYLARLDAIIEKQRLIAEGTGLVAAAAEENF